MSNQVALTCALDEVWGIDNSDAPAANALERYGLVRWVPHLFESN